MLEIWDKIQRVKHNKGYGVQSPAAFHFVTQVLRNKEQYYIYPQLDNVALATGEFSPVHCRRLFRVANYLQPQNIILYNAGKGSIACALSAGKQNVPLHYIARNDNINPEAKRFLRDRISKHISETPINELKSILEKENTIGMLHIIADENLLEVIDVATKHINKKSVIIIEGIHYDKVLSKQWETIKKHSKSVITFDLYSMGIIFFDNEYKKQHYTLLLQ